MGAKEFFENLWDEVKAVFISIAKAVPKETARFVVDNKELIATTILDLAGTAMSSDEKRHEALSRIGDEVGRSIPGMKISNSALRFALELVYQGLKGSGQI